MPKLKTNKSVRNRFKITHTGLILRRPSMQSHFLAKRSSNKKRLRRTFVKISKSDMKAIRRYLLRAKR